MRENAGSPALPTHNAPSLTPAPHRTRGGRSGAPPGAQGSMGRGGTPLGVGREGVGGGSRYPLRMGREGGGSDPLSIPPPLVSKSPIARCGGLQHELPLRRVPLAQPQRPEHGEGR